MRMASALPTLLAVLCGAVAGAGELVGNVSRVRRSPQPFHPHRVLTDEEMDATVAWKRSYWREMQSVLKTEGHKKDFVECCPTVGEMVAKKGGRTFSGLYVELYEDGENKQRLYEVSCAPEVVDKPCRFVDARLYNQSRCVQIYSYSYALVRHSAATEPPRPPRARPPPLPAASAMSAMTGLPGAGGWSMDYVKVRAGCECQISSKRTRPHKKRMERHRLRRKNRKLEDDDDT